MSTPVHSLSYQVYLDAATNNDFAVTVGMQPWVVGDYDYVGLYESYADLEKDFQRIADGDKPDNQKSWKRVKEFGRQYWDTGYPAQSGWLAAYFSYNYAFESYTCITWTGAY